jgi:hypothetical protein
MPTGAAGAGPLPFGTTYKSWDNTIRPLPKGTSGGDPRESVVNNMDERNLRKVSGSISGIFRIEGERVHNGKVVLIDRHSGEWLNSMLTDEEGYYCFPYLDLDFNHYAILAIDPNGVERAEAYDRVYPV